MVSLTYSASRIGPLARARARSLTYATRARLLKHIDGPATFRRDTTTARMITADLITDYYFCRRGKETRLTDFGRAVLAALLCEYAEALVAAGFTARGLVEVVERRPISVAPGIDEPELALAGR